MGTKGHKHDGQAGFRPWHAAYKLEKYSDADGQDDIAGREPDEVIEFEGNLLMNAGITVLLNLLIGGGGTDFDDPDGYLGVGNSSTAAAATQTDLQGASKERIAVASPTRTDQTLTFVATFGPSNGNFAWEEVGIFNGSSGGTMLSRRVSSLGTKASGATWVLTVTLTIS